MQRLTFSMITDMFTIGLALGIMLALVSMASVTNAPTPAVVSR